MLAGQIISFWSSLVIAITGMTVVLIELGLLALLVIALSKGVKKFNHVTEMYELGKNTAENKNKKQEAPKQKTEPVKEASAPSENEEEIAAVIVAICEESGLNPSEFVIKSIRQI